MSKTITSPVKRFSGTIVLPDYLTFPQFIAWRNGLKGVASERTVSQVAQSEDESLALLPAIYAIVSEWHLQGIPTDPAQFPATPRLAVYRLMVWLIGEVTALVGAEDDDPLA
jgi:hypothetical protein